MIRIYKNTKVPQFVSGGFYWDCQTDHLEYDARESGSAFEDKFVVTNGFIFKRIINQLEEGVFRQEYQKQNTEIDHEVIQVDDIRDLVLFLAPAEFLRTDFLTFIHKDVVTRLFRALIIYFEYFLKVAEFAKIRQHEMSGKMIIMQTPESLFIRKELGNRLTQYRIAVAREYCQIVLGMGELTPFYHTKVIDRKTRTSWDQKFHEYLLAVATQIVWIGMHRRAYDTIDWEMNRLFRSEHYFLRHFTELKQYTKVDLAMLYGRNYKRVNFRLQLSPLVQEIKCITDENRPILNFHTTKYDGNDIRIKRLEMEFSAAESQLLLFDAQQGILGHPKKLYNTLLTMKDEAVREYRYNEMYDPYRIINQPQLEIPPFHEELQRKNCKTFGTYFRLRPVSQPVTAERMEKWLRRDQMENYFETSGILNSCYTKAHKELADTGYGAPPQVIVARFMKQKEKEKIKQQNRQKKLTMMTSRTDKYGLSKVK